MIVLLIMGVFIIMVGVMLLFAPGAMYKLNNTLNKTILSDEAVYKHRVIVAIVLILFGLSFGWVYYAYL